MLCQRAVRLQGHARRAECQEEQCEPARERGHAEPQQLIGPFHIGLHHVAVHADGRYEKGHRRGHQLQHA
eukprot:COSAG04_NODE_15708_length_523_cov_0.849057_3_plen_69_part_01